MVDEGPVIAGEGSAWHIAHAAVFLASDDAGFITGVELPVDGGMSRKLTSRSQAV